MRIKHMAAAFSVLAVTGFGLVATAQQKPATTTKAAATATSPVVVYKSPT
jgi:type IV secretory pathway protease TraF